MKRLSLLASLSCFFLLLCSAPLLAQAPVPTDFAPGAITLASGESRYFIIHPQTADPLEFRFTTDDDLTGIQTILHQDAVDGGSVARGRGSVVRRNATVESVGELLYPSPEKTYFLEVRNASDISHIVNLLPLQTRPVVDIDPTATTTTPSLTYKGDVRYYRYKPATNDPWLIQILTGDDLANLSLTVHQDFPDGSSVARARATTVLRNANYKATLEVLYPDLKKTYYLEVANIQPESRDLTFLPFETRPIASVTGKDAITGPELTAHGDARYFKFFVNTKEPLLLHFIGTDSIDNYTVVVHQDNPDGSSVARLRATIQNGATVNEAVLEVLYPDPDKFYYLEVFNNNPGNRSFTVQPFDFRPIQSISGKDAINGPELIKRGDARYFKFFVDTKDPLLIRLKATDDINHYIFVVHQDFPDGNSVARYRGGETDADGVSRNALYEILYPDPTKNYYMEIYNNADGNRGFQLPAFETRPIVPITLGQTVEGPVLNGVGDVRYFKFHSDATDALPIMFRGTDDFANYGFYVRQDNPDGGSIATFKGGVDPEADFEVTPDPKKDYYVEVNNAKTGIRNYDFVVKGTLGPPVVTPTGGDLNSDGKLTVTDVIALLQFTAGVQTPSADQLKNADLNGDGKVNVLDAILLLKKVVGL